MDIPQFGSAHFYKYRPWDDFSKSTLMNDTLFFSSPRNANDPFDCRFPDILKPSSNRLEKYLETQRIKSSYRRIHKEIIDGGSMFWDAYRKILCEKQDVVSWEEISEEVKKKIQSESSFCSLSSINNSPLMFAHYANAHQGICFEFHFTLEFSLAHIEAVQYQDNFEEIDPFNDWDFCDETLVQAMMFRKSSDWRYENEWRAFKLNRKPNVVKFDPRCLSGIIFGCRMSVKHRLEAIKIVKDRAVQIKMYDAVMSSDGVSFDICEI